MVHFLLKLLRNVLILSIVQGQESQYLIALHYTKKQIESTFLQKCDVTFYPVLSKQVFENFVFCFQGEKLLVVQAL